MTWLVPPEDGDPHSIAEFIEGELALSGDEYLSFAELRTLLPNGRQFTEDEMLFAIAEIEEREREGGRYYPYFVADRGVGYDRGPRGIVHTFLVLLALKNSPMRLEGKYSWTDPLFDAVVREASRAYYGPAAKSLVFAWPPAGDRPTTFRKAVKWVARNLGTRSRKKDVPKHKLDAGVDVVVWIPFGDRRGSFQITLFQNTVQTRFVKKPRDVLPAEWYLWLRIGTAPTVGFAIPFNVAPDDPWWVDIGRVATVVLDRRRLISALDGEQPEQWAEWADLSTYVTSEIERIHARGPQPSGSPGTAIVRRRKPQ